MEGTEVVDVEVVVLSDVTEPIRAVKGEGENVVELLANRFLAGCDGSGRDEARSVGSSGWVDYFR